MDLNPRQFSQLRMFDVEPMVDSEGSIWKGEVEQPLFRQVTLRDNPTLSGMLRGDDRDPVEWDDQFKGGLVAELLKNVTQPRQYGGAMGRRIQQNLGFHWTHDEDYAKDWTYDHDEDDVEVVLEADHPGFEHTMSYANPDDKDLLEVTTGPEQYKDALAPEVPIRPGAPMNLRGAYFRGADEGDYRYVPFQQRSQA